jgi:hypothetical protein
MGKLIQSGKARDMATAYRMATGSSPAKAASSRPGYADDLRATFAAARRG